MTALITTEPHLRVPHHPAHCEDEPKQPRFGRILALWLLLWLTLVVAVTINLWKP